MCWACRRVLPPEERWSVPYDGTPLKNSLHLRRIATRRLIHPQWGEDGKRIPPIAERFDQNHGSRRLRCRMHQTHAAWAQVSCLQLRTEFGEACRMIDHDE